MGPRLHEGSGGPGHNPRVDEHSRQTCNDSQRVLARCARASRTVERAYPWDFGDGGRIYLTDWGGATSWADFLAYANDLLLLATSEEELGSMYADLYAARARWGLGFRANVRELGNHLSGGAVVIRGHRLKPRPNMVFLGFLSGLQPPLVGPQFAWKPFRAMMGQLCTRILASACSFTSCGPRC